MKTCTLDGCVRPHRARGMCATHYNAIRYTPEQRHPKVTVACGQCGKPCIKERGREKRYGGLFCSLECREAWRAIKYPKQEKPPAPAPSLRRACAQCGETWMRVSGKEMVCPRCRARKALADLARAKQVCEQLQPRPCADCGEVYTPGTTVQLYCSHRCSARVARRARAAKERRAQGSFTWTQVMRLFLLFDKRCAYCSQPVEGQPDPDHVVPLSRGGHNGIGNILPSCRACNCDKRDLLLPEWNPDRVRRGLPLRVTAWVSSDHRYAHLTAQVLVNAE